MFLHTKSICIILEVKRMEFLTDYYGWFLLVVSFIGILLYKKLSNKPNAITESYSKKLNIGVENINFKELLWKAGFKKIRSEADLFYAESKISLWSWGEIVTIEIISKDSIKITSFCKMPVQVFSWGKNKQNVNRIIENINNSEK